MRRGLIEAELHSVSPDTRSSTPKIQSDGVQLRRYRGSLSLLLSCWLLVFSLSSNADAPPPLSLPPAWEDRVIYYQSFERNDGRADINTTGLEVVKTMDSGANGVRGRGGAAGQGKGIELRGAALSPHRPLTVSFWWALLEDANKDSGFGLFHLTNGRGFVSHFARSGPWCALEQTAGVVQVYYLPTIQNVNGIYDRELLSHVELKAGTWHHTAIVISAGSHVSAYTDGQKVFEVRLTGRSFNKSDQLHYLILGNPHGLPIALDEVVILNRPLTDDEIATYVRAIRQMRSVGYPVEP